MRCRRVDTLFHQIVNDVLCLFLVDLSVGGGKTHVAHTEPGKLFAAELFVLHNGNLL